jgi:hypothetical protein
MFKMLKPLVFSALLLTSCAWDHQAATDTLGTIQDAAVATRETFLPLINEVCRAAAQDCHTAGDMECKPLQVCDEVRNRVIDSFVSLQMAIADAHTASAIGDTKSAEAAIAKSIELIKQIREHTSIFLEAWNSGG